ncbi:MAG TPA: hypothetical protein VLJ62_11560, partial [Burkholderiaceae bacterium]|nr:hypothetical protein [Burkholderiaceae bacterium]
GDALPTQARDVRAPVMPSTDRGVTVRTQRGDTLDSVRREALGQMADAAGLGAAARAEFIERALKLDGGTLNVPAATPLAQARALSASDAQRAIERGTVVVAPTLAQAGLLKLMQSREADPSVPAGAAVGLVLPQVQNRLPGVPGRAGVLPEVAQSILGNVAQGRPPFNPDLGQVGRVSWFVTQGDPYVGNNTAKSVTMPVEIANTSGKPPVQFGERQLLEIFNRRMTEAMATAEAQLRERTGKVNNSEPLSKTNLKEISRNARGIAELAMWTEVGETVRASESGIGKVKLDKSMFSKSGDGEFTLTSKAENVRLPKGSAAQLVEAIKARAAPAEAGVLEAAEKLASNEKWGGRVQGAFRVGGKVLIVVGLTTDAYRIYTATDKVKTSVEVAGGWTGAAIAGGAFAAWYAPADLAGPWAWVGHGVGTLVAGGIGYFAGSEIAKTAYELTIEGKPLEIGVPR